jgi:hypothetical protein
LKSINIFKINTKIIFAGGGNFATHATYGAEKFSKNPSKIGIHRSFIVAQQLLQHICNILTSLTRFRTDLASEKPLGTNHQAIFIKTGVEIVNNTFIIGCLLVNLEWIKTWISTRNSSDYNLSMKLPEL